MTAPLLECKDVAVGWDGPVLEHVELSVKRGEIVALLGRSGSGKSTLLRSLCGLLRPLAGEVRLFGKSLYDIPHDERDRLLRRIGVAFQQDALFSSMTIQDNVTLPLRELTRLPNAVIGEMARMRLELVGLSQFAHRLPAHISGGQRKRAALARASILDPELILCDEPTSGLDPVIAADIDRTLLQFREVLGSTIVIVSHELESIRATADRAVMLAHGNVAATGTISELETSRNEDVFEFFHARAG
jgi:phospholipid/cholesterol/gamma-HCH transport system ATP-binding protein